MNKRDKRVLEYPFADIFRLIAAAFIVGIHIGPLASVNESLDFYVTYCIGRIGVPFFMMVTGYFALSTINKEKSIRFNLLALRKLEMKFIKIYIFATLLYLPATFYSMNIPKGVPKLLQQIIFDGTFYHLWYFPAVILGCFLVTVLYYYTSEKITTLVCVLFYIIGLFGDSYYGAIQSIPVLKNFYSVIFTFSSYTRNGIFFAPIFLWLGVWMTKRKELPSQKTSMIGMIISICLLLVEGGITRSLDFQKHNSMYVILPIVMYFMLSFLLSKKVEGKEKSRLYRQVREIALLVYLLHPLVIIFVRGVAGVLKIKDKLVENTLMLYVIVCSVSFFAAWVITNLSAIVKYKIRRKGNRGVD
jgi:surface polysaccharide O-acyltransferase-like enzyme